MYSSHFRPDAIAHRGLHTSLPENSIPAFLAALDAGADGIELDIQATADDVLVVHHDAAISTADGPRAFDELDSAEIATLVLAPGVPVPTLDDTLEAIGDRARVYIEVKARGIEPTLVRCIRRHASNAGAYAVHSFDHRTVKRVLELLPSATTGILQVSYLVDSPGALRASGATDLWQHADFIDAALVVDVHARGGRVIAWTANDVAEWERLAIAGVDAICTDRLGEYVVWRDTHAEDSIFSGFSARGPRAS